jgi:plasmid stabilization system protein ParE
MARVIVSPSAQADAAEIIAYLANKAGAVTAEKYAGLFINVYDRLAVHPDLYATRAEDSCRPIS